MLSDNIRGKILRIHGRCAGLRYGETPLHRPAEPVKEITTDVHELIDDMVETMYAAPGIGLAAPQVGVPLRIFVADPSAISFLRLRMKYDDGFVAYLNGTRVAAQNAPANPDWNSTASASFSSNLPARQLPHPWIKIHNI